MYTTLLLTRSDQKYDFFVVNWNVEVKALKMHPWRVDFVLEKYKTNWR